MVDWNFTASWQDPPVLEEDRYLYSNQCLSLGQNLWALPKVLGVLPVGCCTPEVPSFTTPDYFRNNCLSILPPASPMVQTLSAI